MTVQLPLPGHWPRNMSRRDPIAALEEIERDKFDATYAIELCSTATPRSTALATK